MVVSKHAGLRAQRGLSLSGLLGLLIVLAMVALLVAKVFPTFLEYRSARVGIIAAKKTGGSIKAMRESFDKTADINAVTAITGRDLLFSKDSGDNDVAFSYDKEIPLIDNVKLVIHYEATTDPSGRIPERMPEEPGR